MNYSPERPWQSLTNTSKTTGLSTYYLRRGCKAGTVPHTMSGNRYMVNVPALLEMLDAESRNQTEAKG